MLDKTVKKVTDDLHKQAMIITEDFLLTICEEHGPQTIAEQHKLATAIFEQVHQGIAHGMRALAKNNNIWEHTAYHRIKIPNYPHGGAQIALRMKQHRSGMVDVELYIRAPKSGLRKQDLPDFPDIDPENRASNLH